MYYAPGTSAAWARYEKNITYAYAIELPPKEPKDPQEPDDGFAPPATEIHPTSQEIWAGFRKIADTLLEEFVRS